MQPEPPVRRTALSRTAAATLVVLSTTASIVAGAQSATFAVDDRARAAGVARTTADSFHATDDQLARLIEALLAANPSTAAAWARSRASRERAPQARSLPDPRVSYRYLALSPETRVGPQEQMLELSQGVPWPGKRALQGQREESLAASVSWEAVDHERALVTELKRAYFLAGYLQEAIAVNDEERELLGRFERIALRRYSTGQGIQQAVVKVQTDISRLVERRAELQQRLDVATRRLSQLVGRPEEALELASIRLPLPELELDRAELEQAAVNGHPRVRVLLERARSDRTLTERRALDTRPDFRFGGSYTVVAERDDRAGVFNPPEDNGQDIFGLTVGLNVPIYKRRIRAGIAEARESERATEEQLGAVRDRLRFEVQEAVLRLESLNERGGLFRDVIIPQAEESLASAEAAYQTDRLSFLDLLDAERILFQSRLAYHRLTTELWTAAADVELATGRAFPSGSPASGRP